MILQWNRGTAIHVGRTDLIIVQLWKHAGDGCWVCRVRPDLFEVADCFLLDATTCSAAKAEVERRIGERLRELSAAFTETK